MAEITAIRRRVDRAMLTGEWEEQTARDREQLLKEVDRQAAQIKRVRALYDRRCAQTVHEFTDGEEMFLADLREALDGPT